MHAIASNKSCKHWNRQNRVTKRLVSLTATAVFKFPLPKRASKQVSANLEPKIFGIRSVVLHLHVHITHIVPSCTWILHLLPKLTSPSGLSKYLQQKYRPNLCLGPRENPQGEANQFALAISPMNMMVRLNKKIHRFFSTISDHHRLTVALTPSCSYSSPVTMENHRSSPWITNLVPTNHHQPRLNHQ